MGESTLQLQDKLEALSAHVQDVVSSLDELRDNRQQYMATLQALGGIAGHVLTIEAATKDQSPVAIVIDLAPAQANIPEQTAPKETATLDLPIVLEEKELIIATEEIIPAAASVDLPVVGGLIESSSSVRSDKSPNKDKATKFSARDQVLLDYMLANRGRKIAPGELTKHLGEDSSPLARRQVVTKFFKKLAVHELGADLKQEGKTASRKYWLGNSVRVEQVVEPQDGSEPDYGLPEIAMDTEPRLADLTDLEAEFIDENVTDLHVEIKPPEQITPGDFAKRFPIKSAQEKAPKSAEHDAELHPLTDWGLTLSLNGDARLLLDGKPVKMREITVNAVRSIIESETAVPFEDLVTRLKKKYPGFNPHSMSSVVIEIEHFFSEERQGNGWHNLLVEDEDGESRVFDIDGKLQVPEEATFLERRPERSLP